MDRTFDCLPLRFEPRLVEAVILAWVRADELAGGEWACEYRRLAELAYDAGDLVSREATFTTLHRGFFEQRGGTRPLAEVLAEFPTLVTRIGGVLVRGAEPLEAEGADLRDDPSGAAWLELALSARRLATPSILYPFLRHELMHASDMLDPTFGYDRDAARFGPGEGAARERHRLLWAISVDGRLARTGRLGVAGRADRLVEFEGAYPLPVGRLTACFRALWDGPRPTHRELLALARDPRALLDHAGVRTAGLAIRCLPGVPCPLCRFPTYRWARTPRGPLAARIRADFPTWTPEAGCCERCAELYELSSVTDAPGTRHPREETPWT